MSVDTSTARKMAHERNTQCNGHERYQRHSAKCDGDTEFARQVVERAALEVEKGVHCSCPIAPCEHDEDRKTYARRVRALGVRP